MSDMTDKPEENTIILAGRVVGFIPPTQGQWESMIRISRTLSKGTDDSTPEFWQTQVYRIGTLLESLIAEADRDLVDELYLTGKIDHSALLTAILGKMNSNAEASENRAIKRAKARARRD